jgi:hypothetical protein
VDSGLERQACVVKIPPDLAVEVGDDTQLFGIEKMFGDADEAFIRVHLHLRITDLPAVAKSA